VVQFKGSTIVKEGAAGIPLLPEFGRYVNIGRELDGRHVHYEHALPFDGLTFHWKGDRPASWRVEKMRLSNDKSELQINETLTLT